MPTWYEYERLAEDIDEYVEQRRLKMMKRLKRICKRCEKKFVPSGTYVRYCDICAEKILHHTRLKKKKK